MNKEKIPLLQFFSVHPVHCLRCIIDFSICFSFFFGILFADVLKYAALGMTLSLMAVAIIVSDPIELIVDSVSTRIELHHSVVESFLKYSGYES